MMSGPAWLAELRGVIAAMLRDLRRIPQSGPRTVDALETAVAVLLALGLAALHTVPLATALLVGAGVAVGRHIESARTGAAYIGLQFALAFLVVLVPDAYETVNATSGVERFLGVICGIALLYPVSLLADRLRRATAAVEE